MPAANAWIAIASALVAAAPAGWLAARVTARRLDGGPAPRPGSMIAATLGLFLWAAAVAPAGPVLILSDLLGWSLLCLAVIDVATFRLPDILNLPLIAAGLAASLFLPGRPVLDHLAGAAGGWALLAGLSRGYRAWRGMDGLGLGDAKLLGAAGAWLGWRPLPSVLLIACLAAFAWVAVRRLRSGEPARTMRIAFGAPLALATWIVWLHGPLPV